MVRVVIIQHGNMYAIVERNGVQYKVPLEVLTFLENPRYGALEKKELTVARVVHDNAHIK